MTAADALAARLNLLRACQSICTTADVDGRLPKECVTREAVDWIRQCLNALYASHPGMTTDELAVALLAQHEEETP